MLLDNTQLGPNLVHVSTAASLEEMSSPKASGAAHTGQSDEDIAQEDKPRSRIAAEYLAHGYSISDKAIERAIALDNQHGISSRFTTALNNFDSKYKASEKAQGLDSKYQVSAKAGAGWRGLNSYFEKAIGTPTGQRVRTFYMNGSKQVMDVHGEARRLADLKAGKTSGEHGMGADDSRLGAEGMGMQQVPGTQRTTCNCQGSTGSCPCEAGKCACASCAKNPEHKTGADVEKMGMQKVGGTDQTKCNCGGSTGSCPCEAGKCACASCPKNPSEVAVK